MPEPAPVPRITAQTTSAPEPAPSTASERARQLASFSTRPPAERLRHVPVQRPAVEPNRVGVFHNTCGLRDRAGNADAHRSGLAERRLNLAHKARCGSNARLVASLVVMLGCGNALAGEHHAGVAQCNCLDLGSAPVNADAHSAPPSPRIRLIRAPGDGLGLRIPGLLNNG